MATQRYPQYLVEQPQPRRSFLEGLFYFIAGLTLLAIFGFILYDRLGIHLPQIGGAQPAATTRAIAPAPPVARPQAQPQAPAAIDAAPPVEQAPAQPIAAPPIVTTAVIAVPTAAAIVVPDTSKPLRIATPDVPQATPWVPSAEQTAAYNAVRDTRPRTYGTDATCNSGNATYVTEPITVKDKNGMPIGAVQGWSCESQAAAVAEAQQRAVEMQGGK